MSAAGISNGSGVLDVGCGQGLFSSLFWKHGMTVHGIDLSEAGICRARELYSERGISFTVCDPLRSTLPSRYDCVFARSFSPYNTPSFRRDSTVTRKLLDYVEPGGVFIFAYNSTLSSGKETTWRHHSMEDVAEHFREFEARVLFVNKVSPLLLRRYAFTELLSELTSRLSRLLRVGGDVVAIVKKPGN